MVANLTEHQMILKPFKQKKIELIHPPTMAEAYNQKHAVFM